MAGLVFIDGFDDAANATDLGLKGWTVSGSMTVTSLTGASTRFTHGRAVRLTPSLAGDIMSRPLPTAKNRVVLGAAVKLDALPSGNQDFILFVSSLGTVQTKLQVTSGGSVVLLRGTTTVATSGGALSAGVWNYLEIDCYIDATAGWLKLRVNESDFVTFSGNTKNDGSSGTILTIRLRGLASTATTSYDDLYLFDAEGAGGDQYLGDSRVLTLAPSADSSPSQWTPDTGTDHYSRVSEATQDGDTSYVQTATAGHVDLYALGNLPVTPTAVHAVQAATTAKVMDAATRTFRNRIKSSATTANGASVTMTASYTAATSLWSTDPATGSAWTVSAVNALEAGFELVT